MQWDAEEVQRFMTKHKQVVPDEPRLAPIGMHLRRCEWLQEELNELVAAGTLASTAHEFVDIIYVALGGLLELGLAPAQIDRIFDAVQFANMTKRGMVANKVTKGPDYRSPLDEIQDIVES